MGQLETRTHDLVIFNQLCYPLRHEARCDLDSVVDMHSRCQPQSCVKYLSSQFPLWEQKGYKTSDFDFLTLGTKMDISRLFIHRISHIWYLQKGIFDGQKLVTLHTGYWPPKLPKSDIFDPLPLKISTKFFNRLIAQVFVPPMSKFGVIRCNTGGAQVFLNEATFGNFLTLAK